MSHANRHSLWWADFRRRHLETIIFVCIVIVSCWGALKYVSPALERRDARYRERDIRRIQSPVVVEVKSTYRFDPVDGINLKRYVGVGVTYYAKGEATVPGVTMRSGRHVYDGAVAVSRDMWGKLVSPGDLIWVQAADRWYKVEDTMGPEYTMRIDIFTHDGRLAKSGSSRSDIIVMRQPQ